MQILAALHVGLQVALIIVILAAAAAATRMACRWHHQRQRFGVAVAGAGVLLLAALPHALDTLGGVTAEADWRAWLSLIPGVALPVAILLLLHSTRRQDAARTRSARVRRLNPVTGLTNRLHLPPLLLPALARCRREGKPMALVVASTDTLAAIRETHGPGVADAMLRALSVALRDTTRAGDLIGHLTPDILLACLPATGPLAARVVAERLRAEVGMRLPHPAMDGRRTTVSLAIADVGDGTAPAALEEAMAAAEAALAVARVKGGDTIETALPPPPRRPRPVPAPADAAAALR